MSSIFRTKTQEQFSEIMASSSLVPVVKLGTQGLLVSAQGLGCMGMTAFYGQPKPEPDMINLIRHAISRGITLLNTAELYLHNETLVGKAIKGIRDQVQISTKIGTYFSDEGLVIRGDPECIRTSCEASLKRLDVEFIDLLILCRIDRKIPIEITIGEMKKLVEEGKVKYVGLSEASASTIRRAHAVHPITAIEMEWSLWSREIEEEIVPTCRELGIGIIAYSPLGRGFLSAGPKLLENLPSDDHRASSQPRLQGENLEHNKVLYQNLLEFAERKACTPGQLALAWLQHKGIVVPIPGTTKVKNLEENIGALAVKLDNKDMEELEAMFPPHVAKGGRYDDKYEGILIADTPPLSSWQKS